MGCTKVQHNASNSNPSAAVVYEDEHLINVSSRLCDAACFDEDMTAVVYTAAQTPVSYVRRGETQQVVLQGTHLVYTQQPRGGGAEDARGQTRAEVTEIDFHYLVCIYNTASSRKCGGYRIFTRRRVWNSQRGEFFDDNDDAKLYSAYAWSHRVQETTRARPHRALHRTRSRRETAAASAPA